MPKGVKNHKAHQTPYHGKIRELEAYEPWHPARQRLRLTEIQAYVAKMYNVRPTKQEIADWPVNGVDNPKEPGKKLYIKTHKFCGEWMVHKTDLVAFLEAL